MLRDYQIALAQQGLDILRRLGIVYVIAEVRVGKTLVALEIASQYLKQGKVLFVTKKKAIKSIESDYKRENYQYPIDVINYEAAHKYEDNDYDFFIFDEAHCLGGFPKMPVSTKKLRKMVGKKPVVLLSGTPTPEGYSKMFHTLSVSGNTPFAQSSFYRWADEFVKVKTINYGRGDIKDYKNADRDKIMRVLNPYMVTFTQKQAGFNVSELDERVVPINVDPKIHVLVKLLLEHKCYEFKDGSKLLCDSAAKLQGKIHQIYSGTVICEEGGVKILDKSKLDYIKRNYTGQKIAVFYKYVAEGELLKKELSNVTLSPEEFNAANDKIFISQIQSGSQGINLSSADVLIFYNIDFSAMQYFQARARIQDLRRSQPAEIHWLFAKGGIEEKIMKAVQNKKSFTLSYFKRDYEQARTIPANQNNIGPKEARRLRLEDGGRNVKRAS